MKYLHFFNLIGSAYFGVSALIGGAFVAACFAFLLFSFSSASLRVINSTQQ